MPYAIGKQKSYKEEEHFDPPVINIYFTDNKEESLLI